MVWKPTLFRRRVTDTELVRQMVSAYDEVWAKYKNPAVPDGEAEKIQELRAQFVSLAYFIADFEYRMQEMGDPSMTRTHVLKAVGNAIAGDLKSLILAHFEAVIDEIIDGGESR